MLTRSHRAEPITLPLRQRQSVYLALLHEQHETRAREHGHAYVTPREAVWLRANALNQLGYTIHRCSTMDEDRSDRAFAGREAGGAVNARTVSPKVGAALHRTHYREVPSMENHPTILVIDDDADIRRMLLDVLAAGGHVVVGAANGGVALSVVTQHCPDLILLDMQDKRTVLEALRA